MSPMQTHIKVLGVLHIVFGVLGILIGLGAFMIFGGVAGIIQMDGDPDAGMMVPLLGSLGGIVLIIALVLSVPGILAGAGLLTFQPWARILTIVLSVLDLMHIPFGTALGIYGLWILFSTEGSRLFEQQAVESTVTT